MSKTHEQKFTNALRDIFVGAKKIEGDSGYINLMRIKSRYYTEGVFPKLMEKIDLEIKPFPTFREELFDKLFTFFKRYFSESGSIYFRHTPYYQDIYERIYTDDRDVMLFWKTQNLYYVKTDRLFRSLTVSLDDAPDQKFAFDATAVAKQTFDFDASTLQNKRNNEKRNLVFSYEGVGENEMLKFAVNYSQGATKTKVEDILKAIKKDGVKVNEDQLTRAFRLFERQSEVDFFINKNAKAFLNEQFDLWMYQYLFKNDSTDWNDKRIKQMQALKRVAYAIIEFIAQFEDELVRIWNKPKFALASNYVITFDRVFGKSEDTARKLLEAQGIAAQIEEWRTLGIINYELGMMNDEVKQDSLFDEDLPESEIAFNKLVADFHKTHNSKFIIHHSSFKYLPFDTKHFKSLEIEILSLFDNLDEELDGRLIHSENYQALNTLKDKFREKVKCIYIDPPYNTKNDDFIYKDEYRHSSWLSMIENRVLVSKELLDIDGLFFSSIDENEVSNLNTLLETVLGERINIIVVKNNPKGRALDRYLSTSHEYLLCYAKNQTKLSGIEKDEEQLKEYGLEDSFGEKFRLLELRNTHKQFNRETRPNLWFPIYIEDETGNISLENDKNRIEVFPKWDDGLEGCWTWGKAKVEQENKYLIGRKIGSRWKIYRKDYASKNGESATFTPKTIWENSSFTTDNAQKAIDDIFGSRVFQSPKPHKLIGTSFELSSSSSDILLDFFAGSGTTAHAVINLNREDGGRRKYILVEANDYFHTVILPRVKKVVFSNKWKDGKAVGEGKGVSHFCKYFALEQYEDTLAPRFLR